MNLIESLGLLNDTVSRSSYDYKELCTQSNTSIAMSKSQLIDADLKEYKYFDKSSYFVSNNPKIQTAIETMKEHHITTQDDPRCLLRFDAVPTKDYSGHGNAFVPIYKMSYLRNAIATLRQGSYHEFLYKSSDMNIFFDFDFKKLDPELIDISQFQYDLEQAFKCVLTTWGYTDKYQIKHQSNNLELGFHTHIKGYKINMMVLQFLAFKVVEEFEQYEDYYKDLIDTKIYKQFGSLRKHGFKYDAATLEYINYYNLNPNEVEDYLIYHLIPNSTFITVPQFLLDEYHEFHNPDKSNSSQAESKLQYDVIMQLISENASKYELEIQSIEHSGRGILVNINNEICPICHRSHEQTINKRLYSFERNGTITLNCFQNNAKPKKEFKCIRITTHLSDQGPQKTIKDLMLIQRKIDIGELGPILLNNMSEKLSQQSRKIVLIILQLN